MAGVNQGHDSREADLSKKSGFFSVSGSATKLHPLILLFIFAGATEERTAKAVRAATVHRTANDAVNRMPAPKAEPETPEEAEAPKAEEPEPVRTA